MQLLPAQSLLTIITLTLSASVAAAQETRTPGPPDTTAQAELEAVPSDLDPTKAEQARSRQLRVMQDIIDQQQLQLTSQQQQIDAQRDMLRRMRRQLERMTLQHDDELEEVAVVRETAEEAAATAQQAVASTSVRRGQAGTRGKGHNLNPFLSETARFPLDISDSAGVFIRSSDGSKMLRLYGSLRARSTWEDRDNFHDYDLNIPQVPNGDDDRSDHTINFDSRESRFGMDVDMLDVASVRLEFDFKGTDEQFRRRHSFIRTNNWVLGKTWTAFNTLSVFLMTLDGHTNGAGAGTRPEQIKYMNSFGNFRYQVALEDGDLGIIAPEELNANARRKFPNVVSNLSWSNGPLRLRMAAQLAPNRVRYDGGSDDDLGWGFWAGGSWQVNDGNVLKSHVITSTGQVSALADFAFENYDMVYDPNSDNFENLSVYGAQVGLEHQWTPTLSTSIGGSYLFLDSKSFQEDDFFHDGYKGIVNLIYRPRGRLKGWFIGGELVHAGRTDKADISSYTNRASLLTYYDF